MLFRWLLSSFFFVACSGGAKTPAVTDTAEEESLELGALKITPISLEFPDTQIGSTETLDLVFENMSFNPITVTSAYLDGDDAFRLDSSILTFELGTDSQEIVSVRFVPNAEQSFAANLNVLVSSESDRAVLPIIGNGFLVAPEDTDTQEDAPEEGTLELSMDSYDYGNVSMNSTATVIVESSNIGLSDVTITDVTSSDPAFTLSQYSELQIGSVVPATSNRNFSFSFAPSAEQPYSGAMTITTDSPTTPSFNVSLTGEGQEQCFICGPSISVNPNPLECEVVFLASATNTLTIQNNGDEELELYDVTVINDTAPANGIICGSDGTYAIAGTRSGTLQPGDAIVLDVTLTHTGPSGTVCGEVSAHPNGTENTIRIFSNDPNYPEFAVQLGGYVIR